MRKTVAQYVRTLTSWSFSRLSDYLLCPLKAKLKYLDKIAEPPNEAMARGTAIHTLAERYILGEGRLPRELKAFASELKALRQQRAKYPETVELEQTIAVTKTWTITQWDNWTQCWARIKIDCLHFMLKDRSTAVVTDWKTGKFRPEKNDEYLEQLELYALAVFLAYPGVARVLPRLVYLDAGLIYPPADTALGLHGYERECVPALQKRWEKRVLPMISDTTFAPRPNNLCNWCFYRQGNKANGGGQCPY